MPVLLAVVSKEFLALVHLPGGYQQDPRATSDKHGTKDYVFRFPCPPGVIDESHLVAMAFGINDNVKEGVRDDVRAGHVHATTTARRPQKSCVLTND
jgi:hypothetical protein